MDDAQVRWGRGGGVWGGVFLPTPPDERERDGKMEEQRERESVTVEMNGESRGDKSDVSRCEQEEGPAGWVFTFTIYGHV